MTFRVYFYADQVFFNTIKRTLENSRQYDKERKRELEPEETATCLIICHSACEAFLNIFAHHVAIPNFADFERASILSKIELLHAHQSIKTDWSRNPFQDIRQLDSVRNWLTHFKKTDIGLINSMGQWIVDDYNKRPKIDDGIELNYGRLERYYQHVRSALFALCQTYQCADEFDYLQTENYTSYLVG